MKLKLVFIISILFISLPVAAQSSNSLDIDYYFNTIKSQPQKLELFLWNMPKGGDLHVHFSGAPYAENLLRYALGDHLCINRQTYVVSDNPGCSSSDFLDNAIATDDFYNQVINAWSMRYFLSILESGHDHFFAAFNKFNIIVKKHRAEVLAEIVERAGLQNESYLELMLTADDNASGLLGKKTGWDPDFNKMREKLLTTDFYNIIKDISKSVDQDEAKAQVILKCESETPQVGCHVTVRYLYQVLREQAPEMVFAQLLVGFETVKKDKRFVGLNLVQPEDGVVSMRDYKLHMRMLEFFHMLYPDVRLSLHAGELNDALVSPDGLKSHIDDAVFIGNAKRIGHGVSIEKEINVVTLLREMAARVILVEINLSSNFLILNTLKENHPLSLYLRSHVPIALSTDDEGISRTNLTKEFVLAVEQFNLDYTTLKMFVRNSLRYSFLSGDSLWVDYAYQEITPACRNDIPGSSNPSNLCNAFLNEHEKAKLQWDLERRFDRFESGLRLN